MKCIKNCMTVIDADCPRCDNMADQIKDYEEELKHRQAKIDQRDKKIKKLESCKDRAEDSSTIRMLRHNLEELSEKIRDYEKALRFYGNRGFDWCRLHNNGKTYHFLDRDSDDDLSSGGKRAREVLKKYEVTE